MFRIKKQKKKSTKTNIFSIAVTQQSVQFNDKLNGLFDSVRLAQRQELKENSETAITVLTMWWYREFYGIVQFGKVSSYLFFSKV